MDSSLEISSSDSTRSCEGCGSPLPSRNKRFCGRNCTGKWLGSTFPGNVTRKPTYTMCEWCGVKFYRPSKAIRFCGNPCAAQWRGQAARKLAPKVCEWCALEFQPARTSARFCTKTCRARWVNSLPREKPTWSSDTQERRRQHKIERGGLSEAQFSLWQELGSEWLPEFWIAPLGAIPEVVSYRIDLAHPHHKVAVECDGRSHRRPSMIGMDQTRDDWLASVGWSVLRFSNQEILAGLNDVVTVIRSRCTT